MKKISFALLLALFAFSGVKAQTLIITNNTCEDISYIANYSTAGLCILPDAVSPAGGTGTVVANGGTVTLTITSGAWNYATFSDACTTSAIYAVGNSCSWLCPPPSPPSCGITFSTAWTTSSCSSCPFSPRTAVWANTGGGSATLTFN